MKKSLIISAASALILCMQSMSASADTQNYPGAMCIKWSAGEPDAVLNASELNNPSAAFMHVDCPVIRTDFDGFLHNSAVDSSWFNVVDQNVSSNVCTRLIKYYHVGSSSSIVGGANACSTGWGSASQVLNTGSLALGSGYYHLYFSTTIPPVNGGLRSSVVTYHVEQ